MNLNVPLGRGRRLHLHVFAIDERESAKEYAQRAKKAASAGRKIRRRERMPQKGWHLSASLKPGERYFGTIMKGWFRLGWSRYRFKTVELEFALGGEDSMAQWSIRTPLFAWAFGVRIPRRWIAGWVWERREWSIHFGYIGSLARIHFAHDSHMESTGMVSYYKRLKERGDDIGHVTDAMLWNGWGFYLGGAFFFKKQIVDRIFGKAEHSEVKGEPIRVEVVMPEGQPDAGKVYPATVTQIERTYKRSRGWTRHRRNTEIALEHPPMFAGKGENSYDCDDDCYYSTHGPYRSPSEAVREYVEAVVERRERYGNPSPQPTTA